MCEGEGVCRFPSCITFPPPPPPTAGGRDAEAGAGGQPARALLRERLPLLTREPGQVAASGAGRPTGKAVRRTVPALSEEGDGRLGEQLDLADRPFSPGSGPAAGRTVAESITKNPQRVMVLQSLYRGVPRIAHVRVDGAGARGGGRGAGPA